MAIHDTTRRAGPFSGNGVATAFPFAFAVFAASDVQALASADGTTWTGVPVANIALNLDQSADPGGTVTLTDPLPTGSTLLLLSRVPYTQPTSFVAFGAFLPDVVTKALDRIVAARDWLGRVGYDPVYGARPLKRAVQRYLQDPLAELILRGEVKDGSTVKVDEGDGKLALSVAI